MLKALAPADFGGDDPAAATMKLSIRSFPGVSAGCDDPHQPQPELGMQLRRSRGWGWGEKVGARQGWERGRAVGLRRGECCSGT